MKPPEAWQDLPFFTNDWPEVQRAVEADTRVILPPKAEVFAALNANAPDDIRVVILGQDPYPTPGHAHGLAFSVAPDVSPLPRSLNNIFKEMQDDIGATPPNGDLRFWAKQGVLLLNTALTVPAHGAGGHSKLGWSKLTQDVLAHLSPKPRAFVLWGKPAQSFAKHIQGEDHLILTSPHPSPLSARRGFFGSQPFSRVNEWLTNQGQRPINWTKP